MYCKNCGNKLKENETFCGMCGNKVAIDNTNNISRNSNLNISDQDINQSNYYSNQNLNNNQNFDKKNKNWKDNASFVIGVVSLIAVFIFQIFTIPLSIVGLVFGILAIKENKKYKVGLILNIMSLILAVPVFMLYSSILKLSPANQVIGTWDCKNFSGTDVSSDYIVTIQLNKDKKFMWNKYNDAKNNHVIGTYEFEYLHKTNYSDNVFYYQITLNGTEFVYNGEVQSDDYIAKYEMGLSINTTEAIMINTNSYNMYYCYKSDKTNKKIK